MIVKDVMNEQCLDITQAWSGVYRTVNNGKQWVQKAVTSGTPPVTVYSWIPYNTNGVTETGAPNKNRPVYIELPSKDALNAIPMTARDGMLYIVPERYQMQDGTRTIYGHNYFGYKWTGTAWKQDTTMGVFAQNGGIFT